MVDGDRPRLGVSGETAVEAVKRYSPSSSSTSMISSPSLHMAAYTTSFAALNLIGRFRTEAATVELSASVVNVFGSAVNLGATQRPRRHSLPA
jgi:hypothetical protein